MIFFDLDGTLLDHKGSELLAVKAFYEQYKRALRLEEESFYKIWGQASDKYFNIYLKGEMTFKEQRIERIKYIFSFSKIIVTDEEAKEIFEVYLKMYEENWKSFEDVISCLQGLRKYRLGIITNGDLEQQCLKLDKLKIKDYFDIIITAGEVGVAKPDSKIFQIACNRAKVNHENCVYVGDDLNVDIIPCMEAGLHGIWLNRKGEHNTQDITMIKSLGVLKSVL
ncbi:HAD family hydrolase [Clostridium zeae]|uniref:HAD family hydrolase n=1 Tax=Clostridium zeae TaxID=2759022 RepID=A0ABQ1E544_9CLOT|nr:HAD family hydrolase [Clostridium zeae]GFZ29859.1 HAD family hydrolase [Clostridium zeae]